MRLKLQGMLTVQEERFMCIVLDIISVFQNDSAVL